jgi:hypothetical protein
VYRTRSPLRTLYVNLQLHNHPSLSVFQCFILGFINPFKPQKPTQTVEKPTRKLHSLRAGDEIDIYFATVCFHGEPHFLNWGSRRQETTSTIKLSPALAFPQVGSYTLEAVCCSAMRRDLRFYMEASAMMHRARLLATVKLMRG